MEVRTASVVDELQNQSIDYMSMFNSYYLPYFGDWMTTWEGSSGQGSQRGQKRGASGELQSSYMRELESFCNASNTRVSDMDENSDERPRKRRKTEPYIPATRSGSWALLVAAVLSKVRINEIILFMHGFRTFRSGLFERRSWLSSRESTATRALNLRVRRLIQPGATFVSLFLFHNTNKLHCSSCLWIDGDIEEERIVRCRGATAEFRTHKQRRYSRHSVAQCVNFACLNWSCLMIYVELSCCATRRTRGRGRGVALSENY